MRAISSNAGAQSKRQFRSGTSAVVSGTLDAAPNGWRVFHAATLHMQVRIFELFGALGLI
jgi:hypothetical protein